MDLGCGNSEVLEVFVSGDSRLCSESSERDDNEFDDIDEEFDD
jgi:hypothetical protein